MPRLDSRLRLVAQQIRSATHADIGADHGHLIRALLASGRIRRGIAIDNKMAPLENAASTLADDIADGSAEVRLADGFQGVSEDEIDSVSLGGLGGRKIASILTTHPDRVPEIVIAQPNDHPSAVRRWGDENGFHLVDELTSAGKRPFLVLRLRRHTGRDPVYDRFDDRDVAIEFGPHRMWDDPEQMEPLLKVELEYWRRQLALGVAANRRYQLIQRALSWLMRHRQHGERSSRHGDILYRAPPTDRLADSNLDVDRA
ncbi:MAG: class I SAM-dependent methyltransferase [Planctomycetota bacterium]